MKTQEVKLIVGLGNPGEYYQKTRHNAGIWFIHRLLDQQKLSFEKKLKGSLGHIDLTDNRYPVFIPATYMNDSGQAIGAISRFYKLTPSQILVAHDDLDLPPGTVRLKQGGGLGGHKGLISIMHCFSNADFNRLRIGIGRPEHREEVINYVLHRPGASDQLLIDSAIKHAIEILPLVLQGDWAKAMTQLHRNE